MKLRPSNRKKVDAASKILGLIVVAVGVDNAFKGNFSLALGLIGAGGLVSIVPLFIEAEAS